MNALHGQPGFVDLQVNGFLGINFSAPGLSVDDVRRVTVELISRGTAAYCPTLVTSPIDVIEANLSVLAMSMDEPDLSPHLLGIHLEGPFLAEASKGAHCSEWLRTPDIDLFKKWQSAAKGRIKMLTLAPELPNAEQLIRHAADQGVVISLGHHMADDASIARAVNAGARSSTHLGNGITNELPRHPNPIWSQLCRDELTTMLITDSHHIPPEFIATVLKAKGAERVAVVSDSAPIAGLPPGDYDYFGASVILESSGRIKLKGGSSLAGSSATMLQCMNHLASLGLLSEDNLWRAGRENALSLLGKSPEEVLPAKPALCYRDRQFEFVT
jgi:N-acetylglucosamine-6-phosphate deacetylase